MPLANRGILMNNRKRRVHTYVDEDFYNNFLVPTRNRFSKKLSRPIRSHQELTRILMDKRLVKFTPPRLRVRGKYGLT